MPPKVSDLCTPVTFSEDRKNEFFHLLWSDGSYVIIVTDEVPPNSLEWHLVIAKSKSLDYRPIAIVGG